MEVAAKVEDQLATQGLVWAGLHLGQDISAQVENMTGKVHQGDVHVPKTHTTEEHQNNEQVDKAAKTELT